MEKDKPSLTVTGMEVPSEPSAHFFELTDQVLFPHSLTPVAVGDENAPQIDAALAGNRLVAIFPVVPERAALGNFPVTVSLHTFTFRDKTRSAVGLLARIVKEMVFPDGTRKVVLRGVKRIQCTKLRTDANGVMLVGFRDAPEELAAQKELEPRKRSVMLAFNELSNLLPNLPDEVQMAIINADSPARLADTLADALNFSVPEKIVLLSLCEVKTRLEILNVLIDREVEVLRIGAKIQSEVHEAMGQSQREFYLREQLRTIQQELGEENATPDVLELREKLEKGDYPDNVIEAVNKELDRLGLIPQSAPEYHISYNYMQLLLELPWRVTTDDVFDCGNAEKVLDEDHFGLEEVKKRILEFMAVMQFRHERNEECRAPIVCLVGPPGVGKTSIGRSIARAMGRKFIRVSLGGVRDEAEIRGHRRTYIGAMPGRIVKNIKRVGVANPVFMLDEVDKLANDFRGDPASALLEVLDPEQNDSFADNYVELPFDLSKVFFIATANSIDAIPGPLLDRMEVIRLPGYTAFEKREIAKRYLVPRQLKAAGLNPKEVKLPLATIDSIIENYTLEAGVRELDRVLGKLCRRIVRRRLSSDAPEAAAPLKVDKRLAGELLGAKKFRAENAIVSYRAPGYAVGMAWTGMGGVVLPIEAAMLPGGKGNLKLTGSLGKVMQESAETAFTLVRTLASELGLDNKIFSENDFHVHVPDGATPKDGPSAGVTMVSALTSLLLKKCLRPKLSMTGEITLQGRVTAIGGIREKVVAALRAGVADVVMPKDNAEEYGELPDAVRDKINIHFVGNVRELLETVFAEPVLKNGVGDK